MIPGEEQQNSATAASRLMDLIKNMSDEEQRDLLQRLEKGDVENNKRVHPRKPYSVSVDCVTHQGTSRGTVQNISVGGLLLQPEDLSEFYFGQKILVNIPFPGHGKIVKMAGEVVRIDAMGVGVKFLTKTEQEDL
jgi:hypothetical protein